MSAMFNNTAHYSFQNFGSDYWLGVGNNAIVAAADRYQWRLENLTDGGYYAIQDWTSYQCLFVNEDGSLGLRTCSQADLSWSIGHSNLLTNSDADGYIFGWTATLGYEALAISGDTNAVSMTQYSITEVLPPAFAWSISTTVEGDWGSGAGSPPEIVASAYSTTTAAPVTTIMQLVPGIDTSTSSPSISTPAASQTIQQSTGSSTQQSVSATAEEASSSSSSPTAPAPTSGTARVVNLSSILLAGLVLASIAL